MPDESNNTKPVDNNSTLILTVISRAVEAASIILDQTGVIQVNNLFNV